MALDLDGIATCYGAIAVEGEGTASIEGSVATDAGEQTVLTINIGPPLPGTDATTYTCGGDGGASQVTLTFEGVEAQACTITLQKSVDTGVYSGTLSGMVTGADGGAVVITNGRLVTPYQILLL